MRAKRILPPYYAALVFSLILLRFYPQIQKTLNVRSTDGRWAAATTDSAATAASALGQVDEIAELCTGQQIVDGLRLAGLNDRLRGNRPARSSGVEWETAARYHEYLRTELTVILKTPYVMIAGKGR